MSINMGSLFSDGLEDIKKNPILLIPNILVSIAYVILSFIIAIFIALAVGLIASISSIVGGVALIAAVIIIYGLIFAGFSYLQAGLTGMAFEAVKDGTTEFSSFFSYGNKYFLRILSAIILMAFIFGIPIGLIYVLVILFAMASPTLGLILMLVSLLFVFIYVIVLSLYLFFVTYAIVIDDTPVIESIRKSIALFNENKSDVLVFFVYLILIALVIFFVYFVLSLLSIIPLLGLIFILISFIVSLIISICLVPYLTVVETRLYLELTRKECCCSGDCLADGNIEDDSENENESDDADYGQETDDEKTSDE